MRWALPSRCYVMVRSGTAGRRTRSAQTTLNVRSPSSWCADRDRRTDPPSVVSVRRAVSQARTRSGGVLTAGDSRADRKYSRRGRWCHLDGVRSTARPGPGPGGRPRQPAPRCSPGVAERSNSALVRAAPKLKDGGLDVAGFSELLNTWRRNCPSRVQPRRAFELNGLSHRIRLVSVPEGSAVHFPT